MSELTLDNLQAQLLAEVAQNDWLQERLADLELALEDQGWERLAFDSQTEFSRDGLDRLIALSRLNTLKNPLIGRGVRMKSYYVWGQDVEIRGRDDAVNQVVQTFLDDPSNRAELFDSAAQQAKDRTLTADGNVVLVLFPNQLTGAVKVRSVNVDEIRDVVTNPDDRQERWFYLRRWTERTWALDGPNAGINRTAAREAWYPDWRYRPATRVESIGRVPVRWDSPIMHVRVGGLEGMRFGVPETYAALDWAKAYKLFLEDWASIVRALSRFAMRMTVKRNPAAAATRLGTTVAPGEPLETNPSPVTGATFVGTADTKLEAIPKSDATVASADGVWLAKMVAAALDIPYTILMADPDIGNLATAKTLDRPTELAMMARQTLWADVYRDLGGYQVDWAARAPAGPLSGTVVRDGNTERVELAGVEDRTIEVNFLPILDDNVLDRVKAIALAAAEELLPAVEIMRLLAIALGIEEVDELVAAFDEEAAERRRAARQSQPEGPEGTGAMLRSEREI